MQGLIARRIAACAVAFCACAAAHGVLPESVAGKLRDAGIPADAMGTIVLHAATGKTVLDHQAGRPFQPASTLKLLTAIVALEELGPAWRGRSELASAAALDDGVLHGDLVLRGGADPDLDWAEFRRLLVAARARGIREIAGDFIVDASLFNPPRADNGIAPFDDTPEFRYNVIPDAVFLNAWLMGLELSADSGKASVAVSTPLEGVAVDADFTLIDGPCADWEDGWKLPQVTSGDDGRVRVRLWGTFPRRCSASTRINVLDREQYADRLFRALWRELGGTFRGRTRFTPAPGGERIASHTSRALAELVRDVNKRSDNPVTRIVYLALGTLDVGPAGGTTAARAEGVVRAWLKARGIDDAGLVLENGSGLSRSERITPGSLARVIHTAQSSRWAPEFFSTLPIVGVDGGMHRRLKDSPAASTSRIKTGTLRDVSAVAGIVQAADGTRYIVVAMINHEKARPSAARPILDALLDWVARRN
jgi:D-alanyl-D-alanine carboxypeptidase/D-alanyl-D-alanine-endopeptidase (penicillin-binding protein 4)